MIFNHSETSVNTDATRYLNKSACKLAYLPNCDRIYQNTFQDFDNLQVIYAPNVRYIEAPAFINCPVLSIIWTPKCDINSSMYIDCNSLINIHASESVHELIHIKLFTDDIAMNVDCEDATLVQSLLGVIAFDSIHIINHTHIPVKVYGVRTELLTIEGDVDEICNVVAKYVIKRDCQVRTSIHQSTITMLNTDEKFVNTKDYRTVQCLLAPLCSDVILDLSQSTDLIILQASNAIKLQLEMGHASVKRCTKRIPHFDCPLLAGLSLIYDFHSDIVAYVFNLKRYNPYLYRLLQAGIIYDENASEDKCINGFRVLGNVGIERWLRFPIMSTTRITPTSLYPIAIETVRTHDAKLMKKVRRIKFDRFIELVEAMNA